MRRARLIAPVLAALLLGVAAGRAATNSTSVPNATLGQASTGIVSYTISAIVYTLDASSPQNVDQVAFTISPATPRVVKVKLHAIWYSCTNASGSVTCATTSPQLTAVNANGGTLTVVAAQ